MVRLKPKRADKDKAATVTMLPALSYRDIVASTGRSDVLITCNVAPDVIDIFGKTSRLDVADVSSAPSTKLSAESKKNENAFTSDVEGVTSNQPCWFDIPVPKRSAIRISSFPDAGTFNVDGLTMAVSAIRAP